MSQMPVTPGYQGPVPGAPKPAGMAIASMVLGIISIPIFCIWYVSIPCAIVGIILGFVAKGKVKRGEGGGGGMATAGIVCGIVAIALVILAFAGLLALLGYGAKKTDDWNKAMQDLQKQTQNSSRGMQLNLQIQALWNIFTTSLLK